MNGRLLIDNEVLMEDFGISESQSLHLARDYFNTLDDAAVAFSLMYNPKSISGNVEYSANLFYYYGNYFFENVDKGTAYRPEVIDDWGTMTGMRVGHVHTHGAYERDLGHWNYSFSPPDKNLAKKYGMPFYMATPDGLIKKYDPSKPILFRTSETDYFSVCKYYTRGNN